MNVYTYCSNNPIIYIDPSGHIFLQLGSTGDKVKELQQMLGVEGDKPGMFGENTLKAVNDYKKKHGLGNTGVWEGVVGDQTCNSIKGEPYQGKVDHDDSVYIDSTGMKIYSNTKSGVTIEKQVIIQDQPGAIDDFKRIPTTVSTSLMSSISDNTFKSALKHTGNAVLLNTGVGSIKPILGISQIGYGTW